MTQRILDLIVDAGGATTDDLVAHMSIDYVLVSHGVQSLVKCRQIEGEWTWREARNSTDNDKVMVKRYKLTAYGVMQVRERAAKERRAAREEALKPPPSVKDILARVPVSVFDLGRVT